MTISIQRIAWALCLAMGMIAILLADQSSSSSLPPTRSEGNLSQQSAGDSEESSPAESPDLVDPCATVSPSGSKDFERSASDGSSNVKDPPRRTAAHRRAIQLLRRGRMALENGNFDRVEQLVRLAEATRVQFDERDSDTPAKLRRDLAQAQRPPVEEQSTKPATATPVEEQAPKLVIPAPEAKQALKLATPRPPDETPTPGDPTPMPETQQQTIQLIRNTAAEEAPVVKPVRIGGIKKAAHLEPVRTETSRVSQPVVTPRHAVRHRRQAPETVVPAAHEPRPKREKQPEAPETIFPPSQPTPPGDASRPRQIVLPVSRRISQGAVAQKLLADARQAIAEGDLDRGAALALRAKGLGVRYSQDGDTPDKVLRRVARLNEQRSFDRPEPSFPADTPPDATGSETTSVPGRNTPVNHSGDSEEIRGFANRLTNGQVPALPEACPAPKKAADLKYRSHQTEVPPPMQTQAADPAALPPRRQPPIMVENLHFASAVQQPTIGEEIYDIPTPPLEPSAPGEEASPTYEPDRSYPRADSPDESQLERGTAEPEHTVPPARLPDEYFEPPLPQPTFDEKLPSPTLEPFVPIRRHLSRPVRHHDGGSGHGHHARHPCHCQHHQHGHEHHGCGGSKLPLWQRILRCLCPKHRCIPIRPPALEESIAGYYSTTWHRPPTLRDDPLLRPVNDIGEMDAAPPTDLPTDERGPAAPTDAVQTSPGLEGNGLDPNTEVP